MRHKVNIGSGEFFSGLNLSTLTKTLIELCLLKKIFPKRTKLNVWAGERETCARGEHRNPKHHPTHDSAGSVNELMSMIRLD